MTTRYVAQYHMHGALVTEGEPWLNRADAEREANLWASIRALRETVTGNARDGYYAGATGRIAVVTREASMTTFDMPSRTRPGQEAAG